MRLVIGVVVVAVLAGAAGGFVAVRHTRDGATGPAAKTAPSAFIAAPVTSEARIVGALPAERRVLRAILQELGPSQIRRIGIKPINPLRRHGLPPDAVMLTVGAGTSLRGRWEAHLVVGRYTAQAWRLHLRKPRRLRVDGGTTGARPVRVSSVRVDLASAREVLRKADVRLVEVGRPFGALVLTVRASDPASFLKYDAGRFLKALGSRPSTYWAVEDASGAVVYAGGTLPGVGMMMARPDLDSCGPIMHSQFLGGTHPDCPA